MGNAPTTPEPGSLQRRRPVPLREAFWIWVKVALYSFGGPAGQIAVMHRLLVEEKRWIGEGRFLNALNYCMLLPGPEAQQLATYIGWLLHRVPGGLLAGILFVLPGFTSILILSLLYAGFQESAPVQALFYGLKPAVLAVIVQAVSQIGRRALKNSLLMALAGASFVAIFFFGFPFPFLVLAAGLFGLLNSWMRTSRTDGMSEADRPPESEPSSKAPRMGVVAGQSAHPSRSEEFSLEVPLTTVQPSLSRALRVTLVCVFFWFGPLIALTLWSTNPIYLAEWTLFSKAAVVTFGGAYAALAYVAEEAVNTHGWLSTGEMLDGLGMAETTPGPLIQVVQFVGFMGAYRNPGTLDPVVAGILGSLITTWVTFVPCFLWIFVGAPSIESLRSNRSLSGALSAITAAVVGVVLNLGVWFSIRALFAEVHEVDGYGMRVLVPDLSSLDPVALSIALAALTGLFYFRTGMIKTLTASALAGWIYFLLFRSGGV